MAREVLERAAMRRLLSLVAVFAWTVLSGCFDGEYLSLKSDPPLPSDDDSNVRRIYEGDVFRVVATLRKPENNAETVVVVGTFSFDDPTIISVQHKKNKNTYILKNLTINKPTNLHKISHITFLPSTFQRV